MKVWDLIKYAVVAIGGGLSLAVIYRWFMLMCELGPQLIDAAGFGAFFLVLFKMTALGMIATGVLVLILVLFLFMYAIADSEGFNV